VIWINARLAREANTVAAKGNKYANRCHSYFRFDGDKIAEVREYCDTNHLGEVLRPDYARLKKRSYTSGGGCELEDKGAQRCGRQQPAEEHDGANHLRASGLL